MTPECMNEWVLIPVPPLGALLLCGVALSSFDVMGFIFSYYISFVKFLVISQKAVLF